MTIDKQVDRRNFLTVPARIWSIQIHNSRLFILWFNWCEVLTQLLIDPTAYSEATHMVLIKQAWFFFSIHWW